MRTQHRAQIGRLALAFTLVSGLAVAGPAPKPTKDRVSEDVMDGRARIAHEAFIRDGRGRIIEVPVTIDVTKVARDGRLAVLGAYVARVDFDKNMVQFLGVVKGSDSHFVEPVATPAQAANLWGFAKLTDVQGTVDEPTGVVNVARARFRETADGGADSIYVTFESLATTIMRDGSGQIIGDIEIPVYRDENDEKHALVAPNPLTGPGSEGATPGTSGALNTFVTGSTATDNCTAMGSLTHLPSQKAGVDIISTTFFPAGPTVVTFRWQDAALNIGTANATATIQIFGDLNLTNSVTAADLTILKSYLSFGVTCGVSPWTAPCTLGDTTHDGPITAADLTKLKSYISFGIGCLIP